MVGTVNCSSFQACRAGAAGHVISEETFLKLFHQGRPNRYRRQDDLKIISFDISIRCGCDTTKAHWQRRLKNRTKIVIRSPAHSHGHVKKSFQYSCKSKKFLMRQGMWPILPWLRVNSVALYPFLGMYLSYSIAQIERISSQTQIEFRNWIATERILILLGVRVRSSQHLHPRLVSILYPALQAFSPPSREIVTSFSLIRGHLDVTS